jgi:glutamate-1-semialdehyde aminotransferase
MEKSKSWKKVSYLGNYLRKKLSEIIEKHGVNVEIKGLLAIPSFSFKNDKNNILKTFVTQEMLKNGFIINNAIYISTAHNKKILDNFLLTLEKIFKVVKKYPIKKIKKLLISRESISGFGRLN